MVLAAAATVPPIRLLVVELSNRKPELLGRGEPVAPTPILLPCTMLPVVPAVLIEMPYWLLPAITFPAPGAVPPIVVCVFVPNTARPWLVLPTSRVPDTSVPM